MWEGGVVAYRQRRGRGVDVDLHGAMSRKLGVKSGQRCSRPQSQAGACWLASITVVKDFDNWWR